MNCEPYDRNNGAHDRRRDFNRSHNRDHRPLRPIPEPQPCGASIRATTTARLTTPPAGLMTTTAGLITTKTCNPGHSHDHRYYQMAHPGPDVSFMFCFCLARQPDADSLSRDWRPRGCRTSRTSVPSPAQQVPRPRGSSRPKGHPKQEDLSELIGGPTLQIQLQGNIQGDSRTTLATSPTPCSKFKI